MIDMVIGMISLSMTSTEMVFDRFADRLSAQTEGGPGGVGGG